MPEDTGGIISFRFNALCSTTEGNVRCGRIEVTRIRAKVDGRVAYQVTNVHVDDAHRRQGIATKLYEAAAREACRRRGRLASTDRNPGAYSHDFWAKQERKGRATRVRKNYVITDCPPPALDGPRSRRR